MAGPLRLLKKVESQNGVVIVFIAVAIFALFGFAALAIDIGHIFVVNNELKNAADAGALAGARFLYNTDGTAVNEGANLVAYNAAIANRSDRVPVDVHWSRGNTGDVERGHWSFTTCTFTPNSSVAPHELWRVPTAALDTDTDFINAIRVKTRREDTPASSFFARIFGFASFTRSAESVAYIGYSGKLNPGEADQPIAICAQSITGLNNEYTCVTGRMLTSGPTETRNTGAWTSYEQPCSGASSSSVLKGLVCNGEGNSSTIKLGEEMSSSGGVAYDVLSYLISCWTAKTAAGRKLWQLNLVVIDCPGNNTTSCAEPRGAVTVNVIWINGNNPKWEDVPREMYDLDGVTLLWSSDLPSDKRSVYPDPDTGVDTTPRWNNFVERFNLKNVDGDKAPYWQKSIYFLPDCSPHELRGNTGGENFGVLARIPVLVK